MRRENEAREAHTFTQGNSDYDVAHYETMRGNQ